MTVSGNPPPPSGRCVIELEDTAQVRCPTVVRVEVVTVERPSGIWPTLGAWKSIRSRGRAARNTVPELPVPETAAEGANPGTVQLVDGIAVTLTATVVERRS